MKTFNFIALAAVAASSFAFGQEAAAANKVKAYVQLNKGGVGLLTLDSAKGSVFQFTQNEERKMLDANKCKLFYINTPDDLAAALKTYSSRDYAAARKQLAACRTKYMPYAGLPGNPSLTAALLELQCAVNQLDWEGVKAIAGSFPTEGIHKSDIGTILRYKAAGILGNVSDDAAASESQIAAANELLNNKGAMKRCDSTVYGWLKYALGRAQAAQIPAEEVNGTISEGNVAKASEAIDTLCQAAMSSHSADRELALDAMTRAQALLWAMPGVQDYANRNPKTDAAVWGSAPHNFKDAVALAYIIKNVYCAPHTDAKIKRAASLFFNTLEGKTKN